MGSLTFGMGMAELELLRKVSSSGKRYQPSLCPSTERLKQDKQEDQEFKVIIGFKSTSRPASVSKTY